MKTGTLTPSIAFMTFVWVVAGALLVELMLLSLWEIFWTDLLHHNPHCSVAHAVFVLPPVALLAIVIFIIFSVSGAVLLARISHARWCIGASDRVKLVL